MFSYLAYQHTLCANIDYLLYWSSSKEYSVKLDELRLCNICIRLDRLDCCLHFQKSMQAQFTVLCITENFKIQWRV